MQNTLQLINDLIQFKADTTANANKAIDYCAGWLRKNDIDVQVHENNGYKMLTAWKKAGNRDQTIILHGHVDVVPAKEEQYFPRVEGNRLYGRGSYDMLGAVVAMMHLLKRTAQVSTCYNILFMLVSDEESGSDYCTPFLIEKGYLGDFVICGEPTNLTISLQSKGAMFLELEVGGVAAHGSRPWLGENAIEKALEVYNRIKGLEFMKFANEFFKSPSLNLAKIYGGKTLNKVPDQCIMNIDIRFVPGQDPENIIREIHTIPGIKTIRVLKQASPVCTARDDYFVNKLSTVIKGVLGESTVTGQDGSGDTRFFSDLGIPAIEFGPGGANHHGDHEYVDLHSLQRYEDILWTMITDNLKMEG